MNAAELVGMLREQVKAEGGIVKFCDNHDISIAYVGNVMYRGEKPGPKIIVALGMKRVTSYEPVK